MADLEGCACTPCELAVITKVKQGKKVVVQIFCTPQGRNVSGVIECNTQLIPGKKQGQDIPDKTEEPPDETEQPGPKGPKKKEDGIAL